MLQRPQSAGHGLKAQLAHVAAGCSLAHVAAGCSWTHVAAALPCRYSWPMWLQLTHVAAADGLHTPVQMIHLPLFSPGSNPPNLAD